MQEPTNFLVTHLNALKLSDQLSGFS